MADLLTNVSRLEKTCDYVKNRRNLYKAIDKVDAAARKADPKNAVSMEKMLGITDTEMESLLKLLDKRLKATEAVANSKFPAVDQSRLDKCGANWLAAAHKYGDTSSQSKKARAKYLSAMIDHELALRERTSYCDNLVKYSTKSIKEYKTLLDIEARVNKLMMALIAVAFVPSTEPQVAAMKAVLKLQKLKAPTKSLVKAHEKIVKVAKAEKKRQEPIQKGYAGEISRMQGQNLADAFKSAMEAFGIAA